MKNLREEIQRAEEVLAGKRKLVCEARVSPRCLREAPVGGSKNRGQCEDGEEPATMRVILRHNSPTGKRIILCAECGLVAKRKGVPSLPFRPAVERRLETLKAKLRAEELFGSPEPPEEPPPSKTATVPFNGGEGERFPLPKGEIEKLARIKRELLN